MSVTDRDDRLQRGRLWPWGLGLLIASGVTFDFAFLYVASTHPSFAVEENYYERGLDWRRERRQRDHNAQLGWTIRARVAPYRGRMQPVQFHADLVDADGVAIDEVHVTLRIFHRAEPRRVLEATLLPLPVGGYGGVLAMRRAGLWQARFVVDGRGEHYTSDQVVELRRFP